MNVNADLCCEKFPIILDTKLFMNATNIRWDYSE